MGSGLGLGEQLMMLLLLLLFGGHASLLDLLEVATQGIATRRLDNGAGLTGQLRLVVIVVRARVAIIFTLLLLLALLAAIDVILELNAHLSIRWLILNEGMLQQILGIRPLVIVLNCECNTSINI